MVGFNDFLLSSFGIMVGASPVLWAGRFMKGVVDESSSLIKMIFPCPGRLLPESCRLERCKLLECGAGELRRVRDLTKDNLRR